MKIKCNFKGEKNGNAKLTQKDVDQIIYLYSTGAYTLRSLAETVNVSKSQIYRIVKRISWA